MYPTDVYLRMCFYVFSDNVHVVIVIIVNSGISSSKGADTKMAGYDKAIGLMTWLL